MILVFSGSKVDQSCPGTFITLISYWIVLHTLTSLSDVQLSLLLFPLLLLRLGWLLLLPVRKPRTLVFVVTFPLVCKLFGVWSLFALSTLFIIADHTIVKNGLSCKLFQRQLLQHLSVTLYAKMVLRHYAFCSEDSRNFD